MSLERLGEWEAALQSEVENLQKRRDQVDAELQRTLKKLDLVRQMRLLEEGPARLGATTITAHKDVRATPTAVREMAHKILSEATVLFSFSCREPFYPIAMMRFLMTKSIQIRPHLLNGGLHAKWKI